MKLYIDFFVFIFILLIIYNNLKINLKIIKFKNLLKKMDIK